MAVTQEELGRRIRAARESCSLTQEALAESCGLTRTAIVQIEQGNRAVSSLELDKIAFALGRDIRDFFSAEFAGEDTFVALFRLDPQLSKQTEVVGVIRSSVNLGREITNLEQLLGIDRAELTAAYDFLAPSRKFDAIQQGERVAREERQRLGLGGTPLSDIAELLESQGVHAVLVDLPDNISGLTFGIQKSGPFVVINGSHHHWRQRFSIVHEYGHVLMDRARLGAVSRDENRDDMLEVRANAFAAEFLMPVEGVRQFVASLGKGRASRSAMTLFDEQAETHVEGRAEPRTQEIQMYDVALLAHHFGVSRQAAVYKLKNLKLIDEAALERLLDHEKTGDGKAIAQLLDLDESAYRVARDDFRRRFLGLALEAYRRDEITRAKFVELGALVNATEKTARSLLSSARLESR